MVELGQLQESLQAFAARGVSLVAVSVDAPEVSARLQKRLRAGFPVLSDPGLVLIDRLGLRHERAYLGRDMAIPTLFLVDREGIVRWVYRPPTIRVRAKPAEILRRIDGLLPYGP
ncbi:MAG: peroxiredoxin family protein [Armatimonadetes bacterium]|nr:peroxiredoxin family protein [Armatimonadota bacterium]